MRRSNKQSKLRDSVQELENRMTRADSLMDTALPEPCRDVNNGRGEVYRDKNTLVEVTIHRRPKDKSQSKEKDVGRIQGEYSRPTVSSMGRSKGKEKGRNSTLGIQADEKCQEKRTVADLMKELRQLVDKSGVNEVKRFLEEVDKDQTKGRGSPRKSADVPCQTEEHRQLEKRVEKFQGELEKCRSEAARYKHEYGVVSKQSDLRLAAQENLHSQVVDLKKIISRLTKNNSELLSIVAEKINYEEQIGGLEGKIGFLNQQLESEKRRTAEAEKRLLEADRENASLRALTADLRAGLQHGLAGLQIPRPASAPVIKKGDKTREILGATLLAKEDSEDSAIEDPNSESIKSSARSKPQERKSPGPVLAPPHTPPTKQRPVQGLSVAMPISSQITTEYSGDTQMMPPVNSQQMSSGVAQQRFIGQNIIHPLYSQFISSSNNQLQAQQSNNHAQQRNNQLQVQQSRITGQERTNILNNPQITTGLSLPSTQSYRQGPPSITPYQQKVPTTTYSLATQSLSVSQPHNTSPTITPAPTSLTPQGLVRSQSRSSTLLPLQPTSSHGSPTTGVGPYFQPVPLDLSETMSASEVDIPRTNLQEPGRRTQQVVVPPSTKGGVEFPGLASKANLEAKVQDFLTRLHQDSINMSLDIPQAKSFAGPSMHLSLSGSELGDTGLDTINTTLTEGKFLRGLETSIEILHQAESTQSE